MTQVSGTTGITFPDGSGMYTAASLGSRNRFINGEFIIDQRNAGNSYTVVAGPSLGNYATQFYTVDRWHVSCTGANIASQRNGVSSPYPSGALSSLVLSGANGNTGVLVGQRINYLDSYLFTNQSVTLSVWIATSASATVTWNAYYPNTQNNFTAVTLITSGTFNTTATMAQYTATFNAGANVTNGLVIFFTVASLGLLATFQLSNAQIELGTVATPYEYLLFGQVNANCQRYYEKSYDTAAAVPTANNTNGCANLAMTGLTNGVQTAGASVLFQVKKQTVPTIATYGVGATTTAGKCSDLASGLLVNCSTPNIGQSGFTWQATTALSVTQVDFALQWAANAEL